MTVGENIKKVRKEKNLTQKGLGELSNVATGTIQQYELGKRQPRLEQLKKIAAALSVPLSYFMDDNLNSEGVKCMNFKQWLLENYKADDEQYGEIVKRIQNDRSFPEISMKNTIGKLARYINDNYDWAERTVLLKKCGELYNKYIDEGHKLDREQQSSNRLVKGEASKQLQCALKMPPLTHKIADVGEKFDVTKSEVSAWLLQQPDIMQYVFTRIKNSGFIVYDHETGTWQGRDYKNTKPYREGEF